MSHVHVHVHYMYITLYMYYVYTVHVYVFCTCTLHCTCTCIMCTCTCIMLLYVHVHVLCYYSTCIMLLYVHIHVLVIMCTLTCIYAVFPPKGGTMALPHPLILKFILKYMYMYVCACIIFVCFHNFKSISFLFIQELVHSSSERLAKLAGKWEEVRAPLVKEMRKLKSKTDESEVRLFNKHMCL